MLNYKIDGRAYHLIDEWEDGNGSLEELFKNESKSVITAAFNQYPGVRDSHEYVESLLRLGADPNYTDCDEYSLLEMVMINGCEKTLKTLLRYSPELKIRKYIYNEAKKKGGIWEDVAKRCEVFDDGADL